VEELKSPINLKAVIFDLDGTVLDNETQYSKAFKTVLQRVGVNVTEKEPHARGRGAKVNWQMFREKYDLKTAKTDAELADETQEVYKTLSGEVQLQKGFLKLVRKIQEKQIKIALATSNSKEMTDQVISKFSLSFFDVVTTTEDIHNTKPDPEIFLVTSKRLNVSPKDIIVIEDSKAGVEAAQRAGMRVIGIEGELKRDKNTIPDFQNLEVSDLILKAN
jgi:HAD superfamily hydrolase (TIGR01509 family)